MTLDLIKAVLDEKMFDIQCNISHQCDCHRQITYFTGRGIGRGAKREVARQVPVCQEGFVCRP